MPRGSLRVRKPVKSQIQWWLQQQVENREQLTQQGWCTRMRKSSGEKRNPVRKPMVEEERV
jgi:hypothetical protein